MQGKNSENFLQNHCKKGIKAFRKINVLFILFSENGKLYTMGI